MAYKKKKTNVFGYVTNDEEYIAPLKQTKTTGTWDGTLYPRKEVGALGYVADAPIRKTGTSLLNDEDDASLIASGILSGFREKRNAKKQEREYQYINNYVNGTKAKVGMNFNGTALTEKTLKKTAQDYATSVDNLRVVKDTLTGKMKLVSLDDYKTRDGLENMSAQEINTYNQLYAKNPSEAEAYLDSMQIEFSKRGSDKRLGVQKAQVENAGAIGKAILSGMSVPMAVHGGQVGTASLAIDKLSGDEYNPYTEGADIANRANVIRSTVLENIDSEFGKGAYETAMAVADNLYRLAVGSLVPGVGKLNIATKAGKPIVTGSQLASDVLAGSMGFSSSVKELKDKGVDDATITKAGIARALIEAGTEHASIGGLLTAKAAKSVAGAFVKGTATQMATEGSEEAIAELATTLSDKLILKEDSDTAELKAELIEQGYSEEEAKKEVRKTVLKNVLHAALVGAGSGGMTGGTANVVHYQNRFSENEQAVISAEVDKRSEARKRELATEQQVQELLETKKRNFSAFNLDEKKIAELEARAREEVANSEIDTSKVELDKKELKEIEKIVQRELEDGDIEISAIEQTILKEQADEFNALKEEAKTATPERVEEIRARQIELKSEMLDVIKGDKYILNTLSEGYKSTQAFEREAKKTDTEQTKALYESAVEAGMNNSTKMHNLFDLIDGVQNKSDAEYRIVNSKQLAEMGYEENAQGIAIINRENGKARVLINIDAKDGLETVFGHETLHLTRGTAEYNRLIKFTKDFAKAKGEYDTRFKALEKTYENFKDANLDEEFAANIVAEFATDEKFLTELAQKERNVFQKIYDHVKHLFKMATAGSAEARKLEQIKHSFKKALEQVNAETLKAGKTDQSLEVDYALTTLKEQSQYIPNYKVPKEFKDAIIDDNDIVGDNEFGVVRSEIFKKANDARLNNDNMEFSDYVFSSGHVFMYDNHTLTKFTVTNIFTLDSNYTKAIGDVYGSRNSVNNGVSAGNESIGDSVRNDSRRGALATNGRAGNADAGLSQNGTAEQGTDNSKNQGTYSVKGDKASSDDGVFFDGETQYSLNEDNQGNKLSEKQIGRFKNSKVVDENGRLKVMYHGTARGDRVGTYFDPERATSGPMAYFTDSKEIATNYSRDKADTSIAYESEYDSYETQFRVERDGEDMSVIELWYTLSPRERAEIKEKGKHITLDYDGDYGVIYDEEATHGLGNYDDYEFKMHRGNALSVLVDSWLNGGNIWGQEELFLDVLRLVGIEDAKYMNPDYREEKVYEVYLNVTNPLDTATLDEDFLADVYDWLDATDLSYYEKESAGADMWDKNSLDPYEWAERLQDDIENGTTHAWTSIPDVITDFLKSQGYDGIFDTGGKGGGAGHQVVIPFYSAQIKEVTNLNPTDDVNIDRSMPTTDDIAPIGKYFGKDLKRHTGEELGSAYLDDIAPVRKDIPAQPVIDDAPIRSDVKQQTGWEEDDEIFGTYSGETEESPFEGRDIKAVGKRNVNAYQYDNPEVKPYFKLEAEIMLYDLQHSTKGERIQTGSYDTGQDWTGIKRATSDEIATLLDDYNYSYDDIEKGLNAIIQDHGAENIAVAKRIEFILDERLRNGYTDFTTGQQIAPNQEYIDLTSQKEAPAMEDIAPVRQDIAPVKGSVNLPPAGAPAQNATQSGSVQTDAQIARVLDIEPKTAKQTSRRKLAVLAANILDKPLVFENLSLKTRNRKLQGKYQAIKNAESSAQWLIGNGDIDNGVKALNAINEEVGKTGLTKEFYEYMYHKHNVDRMSLADRYENMENKPVFGDSVTSADSQLVVDKYENQHPEFMDYAKDVYTYNRHLRQQMVDNGIISQETADLWEEMYPHYIPTRRVGEAGLNINVPLDSRRTRINAPIKKATGGNSDILPLFDSMSMRTLQTYKAIAKNSFGVELKNTLGSVLDTQGASLDEVIATLDLQDELLKKGENGRLPTFTVFENGERVTFEITEEMYDAMKPAEGLMSMTFKPLNFASNLHRGLLTEYNPVFLLTNGIKDMQDVLINSQHPVKTYRKIPEAYAQMAKKGYWYREYMKNGGGNNTYFDNDTNTFATSNKGVQKLLSKPPFSTISTLNNFIETAPRLAEYIASREKGASVEVAMLDAARVTTNFKAGGDLTKFLNRNGATFLNASVQGAMQQVRNFREAKANGLKGWAMLATKFAIAGVPAMILNSLIWDDDEEYEELSDYVKQNYHILWKTDDGQFIRIPKGRTVAVIEDAMKQVVNLSKGNDEADLRSFLELVVTNIAPNNPIENNILAPIMQVKNNETWYGEDLVPTRLQDLPKAEQFDETTDEFSKWLGQKLNVSPVKVNYLLDQYSGGVGDMVLPMMTPQAENKTDSKIGTLIAPLKNKFVTDGVINNQNVADFYDTMEELTTNAKMSTATDEDVLMNKYMNSISGEMSQLYAEKRAVQNSDLKNSEKYERVRKIQSQIIELSKEGLNNFSKVEITGDYATVGDIQYIKKDGEWKKLDAEQVEKQDKVTSALGISESEYWANKDEYNEAYENPQKYAVMKAVGGYDSYKTYSSDLYDIKADKDSNGKSISGTRKKKVAAYINDLDVEDEVKYILFKSEYPSDDSHNYEIIDYLNSRDDISYSEMKSILEELDFKVDAQGNISW